jgi:hypothetical protein
MSRAAAFLLLLLLATAAHAAVWAVSNVTANPVLRATKPLVVYWPKFDVYNVTGVIGREFVVAQILRYIKYNVTFVDVLEDGSLEAYNITLVRPFWRYAAYVSLSSLAPWRPDGSPPVFYNGSAVSDKDPLTVAGYSGYYVKGSPIEYADTDKINFCGSTIDVLVVPDKALKITGSGDVVYVDPKNCIKWLVATSNYMSYNITIPPNGTRAVMYIVKNPATDSGYGFNNFYTMHELLDGRGSLRASAYEVSTYAVPTQFFEFAGWAIHTALRDGSSGFGAPSAGRVSYIGGPVIVTGNAFSPLNRSLTDPDPWALVMLGFPFAAYTGKAAAVQVVWTDPAAVHTAVMWNNKWDVYAKMCTVVKTFWSTGDVGATYLTSMSVYNYGGFGTYIMLYNAYSYRRVAVVVNNSPSEVVAATGGVISHYDASVIPPGGRAVLYAPAKADYYVYVYVKKSDTDCPAAASWGPVSSTKVKLVFDGSSLNAADLTSDDLDYILQYEQYFRQLVDAYRNLTNTLLKLLNSTYTYATAYGNGTYRIGNTVYSYPGSQVASLLGQNSVTNIKTAVSLVKLRVVSYAGPAAGPLPPPPAPPGVSSFAVVAAGALAAGAALTQRRIEHAALMASMVLALAAPIVYALVGEPFTAAFYAVLAAALAAAAVASKKS